MSKKNIWVFSSVIDNFGDIGVAYRLVRELSKNPEFNTCLFVDDISTLCLLENSLLNNNQVQMLNNIKIIPWGPSFFAETDSVPDVIIETFGCFSIRPIETRLLNSILQINIEYLSAEDWTIDFHLKPSLSQQQHKFFYFLGFSDKSGGLFIEKDYLSQQYLFMNNPTQLVNFHQKYHIHFNPYKKNIFLFGYPSNLWNQWIDIWNHLDIDYELWIADRKTFECIAPHFKQSDNIHLLPFVNQVDFDKLLWSFDIAIVRGEDSFIRAQLAGIPFFWHIYPQKNQVHLKKLQAFWQKTKSYYDNEVLLHHQRLSLELNQGISLSAKERSNSWRFLLNHEEAWLKNTQSWKNFLFSQVSAYEKLTRFIKKQLE